MSLERLCPELKQTILGFLDLVSLINIRNTNRAWRDIVSHSLARPNVIRPARVKLLRLYLDLHLYPSFRASRKHIVPHLKSFSRKQYLEGLQSEISTHCPKSRIPEEFALWILEWPENAMISWTWPGLDYDFDMAAGRRGQKPRSVLAREKKAHWWRTYGGNMLCWPNTDDVGGRLCWSRGDHEPPHTSEPELWGMFVQYHGCTIYTVLFFDRDSARDGMVWDASDICNMDSEVHWQEGLGLKGSWIEWLRTTLTKTEDQYH